MLEVLVGAMIMIVIIFLIIASTDDIGFFGVAFAAVVAMTLVSMAFDDDVIEEAIEVTVQQEPTAAVVDVMAPQQATPQHQQPSQRDAWFDEHTPSFTDSPTATEYNQFVNEFADANEWTVSDGKFFDRWGSPISPSDLAFIQRHWDSEHQGN